MLSFEEVKRKAQKQIARGETHKKETEESESTGWEAVKQKARDNLAKNNTGNISDMSKWFAGVKAVAERTTKYYSREGYISPNKEFDVDINRYLNNAGAVKSFISANKDTFENYEEVMKQFDETVSYLKNLKGNVSRVNEYYSQWESEDAYIKGAAENWEKRQKRYEDNNARIEALKAERDGANNGPASNYLGTPAVDAGATSNRNQLGSNYLGRPEVDPARKKVNDEIEALKAENAQYEHGEGGYIRKVVDDYRKIELNPDFLEKSANRNYENASKDDLWNYDMSVVAGSEALSNGGYFDADGNICDSEGNIVQSANAPVIKDKLGMFLSEGEEGVTEAHNRLSSGNGNYTDTWANLMKEGDINGWKHLNEHEISVYYYLYNSEGQEAAYEFLSRMTPVLTKRETQATTKWINSQDGWAQVGLNVASIPMNVLGGAVSFLDDASNIIQGKETNPYSRAHSIQNAASDIRNKTANDINTMTDNAMLPWVGTTWGDVYQSLMSAGDSALGVAMGGGSYGVLMGMGAASSEMKDLYEKGASLEQIAAGGILAGAAEMVFEKYSIDKLVSMGDSKSVKDIIVNMLKQGGIEASEEMATEIANTITNVIVMGSQSDWVDVNTFAKNVVNAGIGGFISGGLTGGVGATGNYVGNKIQEHSDNKLAKQIYGDNPGALVSEALEIDPDNVFAQKMQSRLDSGKDLSGKQLNKLVQQNEAAKTAQNMANMQATAETRLTELGETGDVAVIAAALTKQAAGEKLTKAEQRVISTSEHSQQVAMELNQQNNTNGVVSPIRTDTIGAERFNRNAEESTLAALAQQTVADRYAEEETASAEGHAILKDEAVDIADVAEVGNGKVTVKLTDGRTIDATALDFEDSGEAELWRVVGKYAADAESARALLEEYRMGDLDAYKYARGVEEAFLYGKLNISPREMAQQGSYVNLLNPTQQNMAYKQGRIAGQKQMQAQRVKLDNNKKKNGVRKGELHFEGDRGKLMKRQKVSLQACEVIAKALGVQVYVFESDKVGGTRVGENGWYDPKDGSIHIDLYAGQNGEGVMVFTLAHELTHFIRDWSPAKFQTLSKFLAEQYAKKGQSVADLVRLQQKKAAEDGRTLSFEEAHEEWVADSMETMLTDGAVVKKLAMLQAKDKGLVEKIKEFLKDFVKRLKEAYQLITPQTTEGRIVADMVDATRELQNLFADALLDAGENFRSAEKNTTGEGGVKRQRREGKILEDKYYKRLIDNWDGEDHGGSFRVGKPSKALLDVGIPDVDIWFDQSKAAKQLKGKIEVDKNILKKIPDILGNPIAVAESYDNTVVVFGKVYDDHGYPIVVALRVNSTNRRNHITLVNKIRSVGTRNNNLDTLLADGAILYLNENKKETNHWFNALGRSTPFGGTKFGLIRSIAFELPSVKENDSTEKRTSSRGGSVSDRAMLVDLFEQTVTDSNEYKALQNYKKNIDRMMALEEHLERLSEEIKRLSFAEGPRDMELLNNLKLQQKKAVQELNRYDNQLLQLEKSGVLRAMVERNRKLITQQRFDKAREYYRQKNEKRESEIRQYYRESRRQAVARHDKAQVRQRIRKDVQRLDSLLNKGTKEKNVKLELQDFAGAALRTAKGVFLKNYNEYEMVRSGVDVTLSREHKAVFARSQELLKELDQIRDEKNAEPAADSLHQKWDPEAELRRDDREEALKKELAKNMAVLRDAGVFRLENERIEDAISDQLMDELMEAYSALQDSESAHVRGVFNRAIYDQMENVKKFLAGKAIKDMTTIELGELQKMYRMVLHTITTSNELFKQKKKIDVRTKGEKVIKQLRTKVMEDIPVLLEKIASFGWSNLSLDTALELIGSDELTDTAQALYEAEDTYQTDLDHAKDYVEKAAKKYERKNWDVSKTVRFAGTEITLGQAMSLYAYTKRKQAQGHLEGEGFTHSKNVRFKRKKGNIPVELTYIKNAALTYKVTKEQYAELEKLLTKPQREYVEAMVEYLSKVMGAKGNEVSMQLYGIKLFEELVYFPINTANEFFDDPLGTKKGEKKLRNNGFTEKTVDNADNPIVLDNFEDVWAAHVEKMSMYHAFVLAMEDFDRVYNYRHAVEEDVADAEGEVYKTMLVDTNESVKVDIENRCGRAATEYIARYMQNLNGGVRGDATEKLFGGVLGNFKKTAVLGSGSVVVQQPAAFIRAMAHLKWEDCFDWNSRLGKDVKPSEGLKRELFKYAPVARMKAMGGFDPSVGRTTRQYLFGEYKDGEHLLKRGIEGLNDFLGKAPEKMDELTWTYIWLCTKRQIHRLHPDLKINSKEFLEKTAERFSYIIRDSQVYDSVMVKPLIMQSKSFWTKSITSFMNEPLKGLNQSVRAWLQWKNGKISGKQCARVFATTYCSSLLAGALSAFFYAARDDDEDESYWEKYVTAVTSKAVEGIIPFYSIPFVKDIISVFEGYGAERADMSLLVDAYQAIVLVLNEDADPWDKLEKGYAKLLNVFGVPASNLVREARAVWRVGETIVCGDKVKTTGAGMKYALLEALPLTKEVKKTKQWKNALLGGDEEYITRLAGTYETEDAANSAVRAAVKELFMNNELSDQQAEEFLQVYTGERVEDAQEKVTNWRCEKETGVAYSDIQDKFIAGEISAQKAKEMCIAYGGYSAEEAQEKVTSWRCEKETGTAYGDIKETFMDGKLTAQKAKNMYVTYGGLSEEKANEKVAVLEFVKKHPDLDDITYSAVENYATYCERAGVPAKTFYDAWKHKNSLDGTGSGTVKAPMMQYINRLNLTYAQKDSLYYALGWKQSKIYEAPWH